jgi:Tfp pilus assembly protein PilN
MIYNPNTEWHLSKVFQMLIASGVLVNLIAGSFFGGMLYNQFEDAQNKIEIMSAQIKDLDKENDTVVRLDTEMKALRQNMARLEIQNEKIIDLLTSGRMP